MVIMISVERLVTFASIPIGSKFKYQEEYFIKCVDIDNTEGGVSKRFFVVFQPNQKVELIE